MLTPEVCALCSLRPPRECLSEHKMMAIMVNECSGRIMYGVSEEERCWDAWDITIGSYCSECLRPVNKLYRVRNWDGEVVNSGLCYHCARDVANCVPASAPSDFLEET